MTDNALNIFLDIEYNFIMTFITAHYRIKHYYKTFKKKKMKISVYPRKGFYSISETIIHKKLKDLFFFQGHIT
jgi:hypothetical protein